MAVSCQYLAERDSDNHVRGGGGGGVHSSSNEGKLNVSEPPQNFELVTQIYLSNNSFA